MWSYGPCTVMGHLASKANGRRWRGPGHSIKSQAALDFVSTFPLQLPTRKDAPFDKPVAMYVWAYYRDMRRDLDIALLQDCIQKAHIIENDRQIVEIHARRFVDKERPRVIFELREAGWMTGPGNHRFEDWVESL